MKKLKIFLLLSLLLCFGFALSSEVHAQGNGPKEFEVNDILPATTQLRISWVTHGYGFRFTVKTDNDNFVFVGEDGSNVVIDGIPVYNWDSEYWISPYNGTDHTYIDINTSNWSESKRTVSLYDLGPVGNVHLYWEDLAPVPSGYTISFNSNGGTTIPDIEDATELPTLPTPTKSGYIFRGWYYDSDFTNEALAGDPLTGDVTLYAKWGPKVFQVGDVLPAGYIKISWDYNGLSVGYTPKFTRIEGTNGFIINILIDYSEQLLQTSVMGDSFDTFVDNITIKLDSPSVITEITSDIEDILEHIFWEVVIVDEYSLGYEYARDKFGYYDPITDQWLSVEEYLELYGTDKPGQSDFYNNFDKYFIPAMIIVFGGAIVLTILKVFKGRE